MAARNDLESALEAAVNAANELGEGAVTSITVDVQASGEYPYRVSTIDAEMPVVGIVLTEPLPEVDANSDRAKPDTQAESA